ncbi:MAG: 23S rRNA (uracil(1939)-C(5))-methyltransferase RlmD [Alphaproteobacteria bacterium]|nr:23S rRNA (uracil(1939)-C(5))-methyltransferase RlmD [Alphaproteobacteria bacterium]
MSKRHPIQKHMPPVAPRRGKGRRGKGPLPPPAATPDGELRRPELEDDLRRKSEAERRSRAGQRWPTVELTAGGWHHRGEAEAVHDGKPVDIWEGIPGETARVALAFEGHNRVAGRFVEPVGAPAPGRREPPCERFTACGGCPLMHLEPDAQRDARLDMLRDALAEFSGPGEGQDLTALLPDTVAQGPDGDEGYRHAVKLTVGRSDRGHLRVGVFARKTHRVVSIPGCNVATPTLRRAMSQVAHLVIELDIWPYDEEQDRGTLRHVVLRQSRSTGEVLVTIVAGRDSRTLRMFAERLAQNVSEIIGVHLHLNAEPGNNIFERNEDGVVGTMCLRGRDVIEERLGGLTLAVGPGDFYQANPGVAEQIAQDLLVELTPDRDRPVVDLYCGVGGFTLALGRAHGWACGVEVVDGAVLRARENARRNRVTAEFTSGDVLEVLPELGRRLAGQHPVVMVDPARRGLGEGVLPAITALEPARLAYLSCNPRALARDLAELVALGWRPRPLRAYDMFPQTAHVEVLALLDPPAPAPEGAGRKPRRRVVR